VTSNEIVLEPGGLRGPGTEQPDSVLAQRSGHQRQGILLTPAPYAVHWVLETPDGDIIDPGVAAAHPMASYEIGQQVALYRVGLPIPLAPQRAGRPLVCQDSSRREELQTILVISGEPAHRAGYGRAHGIRYNFNVHAYSNLRHASRSVAERERAGRGDDDPGHPERIRRTGGAPRHPAGRSFTRPDNTGATLAMSELSRGSSRPRSWPASRASTSSGSWPRGRPSGAASSPGSKR